MKHIRALRDTLDCDDFKVSKTAQGEIVSIGVIDIAATYVDIKEQEILTTKQLRIIRKIQKSLKKTCTKEAK